MMYLSIPPNSVCAEHCPSVNTDKLVHIWCEWPCKFLPRATKWKGHEIYQKLYKCLDEIYKLFLQERYMPPWSVFSDWNPMVHSKFIILNLAILFYFPFCPKYTCTNHTGGVIRNIMYLLTRDQNQVIENYLAMKIFLFIHTRTRNTCRSCTEKYKPGTIYFKKITLISYMYMTHFAYVCN